ncbi:hypothetical protein SAY87_015011 [Trapa incisa]|uniref:non-specific serine/threonine protein kinase n=1 Tax=Trapa incisa TaxID=236973 RepID=A0AAN7GYC5_9MYRT|nr:hypothetical protein SAY87_015011 [Trapa incisa]
MSSPSFHAISLLLFVFFGMAEYCWMSGNETDMLSLLEFKSLIRDDPFGVLTSWNESVHFCRWHGITCSRRQRVAILDLHSYKLSGSISPHLGNLSFLREINFLENELNGEIPPQIGYLKRLETLQLSNNSLTGSIPVSLSNCSYLTNFSLSYNQLSGEIPVELTSLTKLRNLHVKNNNLTGLIPASVGNLSYLESLSLRENALLGSLPHTLGWLKNIRRLEFSLNYLSGSLPPSIFNLSTLTFLFFMENNFQGSLPPHLFNALPNIQHISFGDNFFLGSIPISISNASSLLSFQAQHNLLSGTVPSMGNLNRLWRLYIWGNNLGRGKASDVSFLSSLVNATRLEVVDIAENYIGGRLPQMICNFSTSLSHFSLGHNQISGSIPPGLGHLVGLRLLDMQDNQISGAIPPSIGKLQNLVQLYLDRNRLTGSIPLSIGNLTQLSVFRLGGNFLQERIPPSLGRLQALIYLDLKRNNLAGSIPEEVSSLTVISTNLDLSHNKLVGPLPTGIGNLKNLGRLDVSDNMLSGEIPSSLGSCVRLEALYMAGNKFHGGIPSTLSSLKGLQELNLSRNLLSGQIPTFLESLKVLQILDLSYNNFNGVVPVDGVFKNSNHVFLLGNDNLCGGRIELRLPDCPLHSKRPKTKSRVKIVILIVSSLVGASLLALLVFLTLLKRKRRGPSSIGLVHEHGPFLFVSYHSLLKATDGFSEANLIGTGAFGRVYRGIISEDEEEKIIAVKVLNLLVPGAERSFLAECEALRNIRHRNLVKVLTACSGIDSNRNDFKALVYESMPNGSLEDWLHQTCHGVREGEDDGARGIRKNLSLLERLNIAIDTAWAVEYLHHNCETPIIHRDLKPSNILLDAEMVAHVGDFGLARLIPEPVGQPSANHTCTTTEVKGSAGYVAPEYGMGGKASAAGDIYSYGIVLLEMFTGKRPTDQMFHEELNLHKFVKKSLSCGVEEIIDPVLLQGNKASARSGRDKVTNCLVSVFQVGVACSSEQPKERLCVREVVNELNSIRKRLV